MTGPVEVYAADGIRSVADVVLASLPLSYSPGRSISGSVAVIAGSGDWPSAVADALDEGAVGAIIVWPQPADTEGLRARSGKPIALDSRWSANPVVQSAAGAFADALPHGERIECRVLLGVGASLESALLDQLSLIRALFGEATEVRVLTHSVNGYAAEASAAGHPVDLSVVCTDAVPENATVRLLAGDRSVDLTIPSGDTARPAQLSVTSPDGTVLAPTLYESGHRATWRRVRKLLDQQQTVSDLENFEADRQAAVTAFQNAEG